MRESDVEQYLVERVKAAGGEIRKVKWIGRRGAPDRLAMLPVGPDWRRTVWVELKAPGEKPQPHQKREHDRMRRMGQTVVVLDSWESINQFFDQP
jgi:hypothetical protein